MGDTWGHVGLSLDSLKDTRWPPDGMRVVSSGGISGSGVICDTGAFEQMCDKEAWSGDVPWFP
jgi:hypothetical protein